ncbi:MAG TPA: TIGR04282 family arsenosugar biosynthesis glycosyltransferase [Burkholderiales bacterium]|nr:TIGR04282 family arsenosugar biosynthesis glycosyltransferase [Burkholderiales bacterium]
MRTRIQVFARAPVSGEAKTRLIPRLGANAAARLQMKLTEHALAIARSAGFGPVEFRAIELGPIELGPVEQGPVELWCSPDCTHPSFQAFSDQGIVLRDQGSGSIGERMHRALQHALLSGDSAVLIGSDCPSLTAQDLSSAAQALDKETDFCFIPAEDGGYVLIAAAPHALRSLPRVFENVDWGTSNVMAQTRQRLQESGRTWQELTPRWDVDRPEDYDRLLREQPDLLKADQ